MKFDADPMAGPDPSPAAGARRIDPPIRLPSAGPPLPLVIVLGAVLAVALFLFLLSRQQSWQDTQAKGGGNKTIALLAAPPPLEIPPEPEPSAVALRNVIVPQASAPPPPPAPPPARIPVIAPMPSPVQVFSAPSVSFPPRQEPAKGNGGPAMVIDLTNGPGANINGAGAGQGGGAAAGGDEVARATLIPNRASVIPQGAIIPAVLETPLNSDRPGLARAMVAKEVRGFDGSRVLIPRGSRLVGEFKLDNNASVRRVLVTWTRLIRPDGIAIRIGSPAADSMGAAGIPGAVNTHFAARFFNAVLQTALTVAGNAAIASGSNRSNVLYVGISGQASQVGQQLLPSNNRAPTVKVKGGEEIAVLVARDLDFSGTPAVR